MGHRTYLISTCHSQNILLKIFSPKTPSMNFCVGSTSYNILLEKEVDLPRL